MPLYQSREDDQENPGSGSSSSSLPLRPVSEIAREARWGGEERENRLDTSYNRPLDIVLPIVPEQTMTFPPPGMLQRLIEVFRSR